VTTFTGKIAVVTGASGGIGRAIATELASHGATLCLVGRRVETLEIVAENARSTSSRISIYETDLTQDKDIETLKTRLDQDFGYVDILIHSAGVISQGPIEHTPVVDFDWQYHTNVRAPYLLTQALLPMIRPCRGEIVFINSSVGVRAKENIGPYAASKHALRAISDSLRAEVNIDGIRVLSVYLGRTASPMQAAIHNMEGKVYNPEFLLQPEDVAAVVINSLNLSRSAEVTDISIRPLVKSY